ncbi:hypothetical protein E2I00_004143 [Balaenoptera physalus]|uniref:Uncharacterized protein n=1 Tax=Balaenoptera physalus TaxID=9770 RepID=A0A643BW24_BALPH|nr:hypothetical protein E2I00_004143 [Balaenoptera physalus]
MKATLLKLQDTCVGHTCCRLWACSSSQDFEEACPYCFQLQVLDKAGMYLQPKAKLTPQNTDNY